MRHAPTQNSCTLSIAISELGHVHDEGRPEILHRPIPSPDPDPEPNPSPDNICFSSSAGIASKDWEVLFHAIQQRLVQCLIEPEVKVPNSEVLYFHHPMKLIVWQCVKDMSLLRLQRRWE